MTDTEQGPGPAEEPAEEPSHEGPHGPGPERPADDPDTQGQPV
jgi:hypothetical protein